MKYILLFLMFLVLAAAFILPKFAQRSAPTAASSEPDLMSTHSAVSDKQAESEIQPSPLLNDTRFSEFFNALQKNDFETARTNFLTLSPQLSTEEKTELETQMKLHVDQLATKPPLQPKTPLPTVTSFASIDAKEATQTTTPPLENTDLENTTYAQSSASNKAHLVATFMADVQQENFQAAKSKMLTLTTLLDCETSQILNAALSEAEEKKASRTELARDKPSNLTAKPSDKKLTLPKLVSTNFTVNSTSLSPTGEEKLSQVVKKLQNEPRLSLQLRGYTDGSGTSEYNGLLSQARCEVVKDYFLKNNISQKRISLVSFGETQTKLESDENARRVDIVYREM